MNPNFSEGLSGRETLLIRSKNGNDNEDDDKFEYRRGYKLSTYAVWFLASRTPREEQIVRMRFGPDMNNDTARLSFQQRSYAKCRD